MLQERCHHQQNINLIYIVKDREHDSYTNVILFLNENDLSVSFLNLWGVRSQCCDVDPCSSATADLSLATLIKTAFLSPFSWQEKPLLRRGTGVFFCIHIQRDFSDVCFSFASAPGASHMSAEKLHQPNELRQNNEMLSGYMWVKQTFLSVVTVLTMHALIASS